MYRWLRWNRVRQAAGEIAGPLRIDWLILLLILIVASLLRFINLAQNPGWYTDEGTHLEIARHMQHGRIQYLAITQSTLLFAKLPLFELLLALAVRLWGISMLTLRSMTAACGVVAVGAAYLVARRLHDSRVIPLIAASILAIYPQAVLYSRFGFSYNLLAPMLLGALYGLIAYSEGGDRKWLMLAATLIGLGVISDLWMVSVIPVLLLAAACQRWLDVVWGMLLVILPFGVHTAIAMATIPDAFLFDLQFTLFRLNSDSVSGQIATLAGNLTTLLAQDGWLALGVVGLIAGSGAQRRWLLALFFLPLLLLGRTTALHGLSFYYMIPLLPLGAIGLANLIALVWDRVQTGSGPDKVVFTSLLLLLCLVLAGRTLWLGQRQAQHGWPTAIDPFLLEPEDAAAAAAWVNGRVQPDELVIASPGLAWLLAGQTADFQMAIAATGQATPHLPPDIPAERYAFAPDFDRACYVVVDNLWTNWAIHHVPGLEKALQELAAWPQPAAAGAIRVFVNPDCH